MTAFQQKLCQQNRLKTTLTSRFDKKKKKIEKLQIKLRVSVFIWHFCASLITHYRVYSVQGCLKNQCVHHKKKPKQPSKYRNEKFTLYYYFFNLLSFFLFQSNSTPQTIDDTHLKHQLQPTLRLIVAILERYLKNEWTNRRFTHLPKIIFSENNLLNLVDGYLLLINNEDLWFEFANVAHLKHFIAMCTESRDHMITEHEAIPNLEKAFFLIESAVGKNHSNNVMKLSYLTVCNWFLVYRRLLPITHKDINKDPLVFQTQLIVMQIMPVFHFIEKQFNLDWDFKDIDDLRENYFDRFVRQMCQYTIRLAYNYRKVLVNTSLNYNLALKGLHFIQQSLKHYQRQTAVIVFQALIYGFNDCNSCLKNDDEQIELAIKESNFYFAYLHVLKDLIKTFDFTWKDCVESICVVNVALDFITIAEWPTKV